ncbi:pyridoxamine 5'-phosphate oxidase family protein [Mycobacterium sp. CBMA247]|nr:MULTISPECIES: pyridoxamine 5'-phosphate oxidase family protein [unclassified Mycolicibacterium]MUL85345.1 pyridoxamine 5'-phosphate oxidase family protein [Mycolicibacterium sp. CBMA 329]MUL88891.1 pyridoxamine 5'-phosphate oxidase family protein [Mycolicibacterium sp. CBMA 331]MUM01835.1 pyridoxamine 5'-phosphate oxidase family protein [Mycolicibacterium sp. CBMA 334]MUM30100.1 pyridoxamine 5'-phosphate oxidase family protein [Mycolicibacterium sp. CBMA 295]MUM40538.1 pyridoxamine 5'-phosp
MYHSGELAVQRRMGQEAIAARVGRMIRTEVPAAAAAFLAEQPMIVIAAADDAGRVWTSLIAGPPGFVHADDPRTITVDALPAPGDPLRDILRGGQQVGMIAIEPRTRRRMRVNGSAEPVGKGLLEGLRIETDQVYSNCPKYISRRDIADLRIGMELPDVHRGESLSDRQQQLISTVDTFFIGSADPAGSADASHRGGNPGFLQVISPRLLRWPDYRGNSMFMTLGNVSVNPRCGLLVVDWSSGSTIQLTGTAEINWDEADPTAGAQCAIDFTISEVVELTAEYN